MGRHTDDTIWPVMKPDDAWREQLTDEQFYVTRQAGTERAFTGPNWDTKAQGIYHCICCEEALFDAQTKYDSGTGWPSFYAPIAPTAVAERADNSLFSRRTEVLCANCGAHLGHVFPDGPQPTGLRFCMNGHALNLRQNDDPENS
ncbi:peptide-methionine (R)-S-oxide reductase MsrB [Alphaproteobacteria bacterium]|nr:peptide-methionine (R)-S-oxide reductase MsrB [Alphaproteobacteria bacterium]MDC0131925.1 peptide-methionine (R)-S-oxide reductase MsrB [Alphaproteobacteria bacterium]MDC0147903.1 peptide-methionine (R)-S-oxide reductase MsrB [Alphaproteobacteria bacterium]